MTPRSHATLTGFMTLTLLGPDGAPLASYGQRNSVMPSGQQLLLNLLRGANSKPELVPILGTDGFEPEAANPMGQTATIRLQNLEALDARLAGNTLTLRYRGDASKGGKVIGGGIVVNTQDANGDKAANLYNFAKTADVVEVQHRMPMMVSFQLSVG